MKSIYIILLLLVFLSLLSSCYTYNIPAGVNTPLITEEGEFKVSATGNFNEIGGNFSYGLTDNVVFSSSGNFILSKDEYKQEYDSLFYRQTPNNFEVAFGYYGGKKNFANMFLFGVGAGNTSYNNKRQAYFDGGYYTSHYYQANFIQYFLQYTAGFKYEKQRFHRKRFKEQGLSLRYAYHDYNVLGITSQRVFEEIYNEELDYWENNEYETSSSMKDQDFFNSFSVYYFYRTGNKRIQFEVSQGFSFYDRLPNYEKQGFNFNNIHFNVGLVFNINNLISLK